MDYRDCYIEAVEEIGILRDDLEEMTARAEAAEARLRGYESAPVHVGMDVLRARAEAAEAERDALAAELAAIRGEAAPDGWRYDRGTAWWCHDSGSLVNAVPWGGRHRYACRGEAWSKASCRRLTGPDGAFAAAEAAARGGDDA